MRPAAISGATHTFSAPKGWDESVSGPCADLDVRRTDDICESAWRPTAEELAALNAGGVVVLSIMGGQPPVMLSVEYTEAETMSPATAAAGDA